MKENLLLLIDLSELFKKIITYMTVVSKNVYVDKWNDIVNENNNTYHRTIKMKPADVKDNFHIDSSKDVTDKDPKFKVGDHVRISKHKNVFAKGYTPDWSEDVLAIKEVKLQFHGDMLLIISMVKKLLKHFMKKKYKIKLTKI